MRDIWNPWHGCRKMSEGCLNCYMYYLDALHGRDGSIIHRSASAFTYPLAKNRAGDYKVPPFSSLRVCLTSDFFLEEADAWREEAWEIMARRPDLNFFILTKRVARVAACLPGAKAPDNVCLCVSCENQRACDTRLPALLELPFRHKSIMLAPLIAPVHLAPYLAGGEIEHVMCDGENYPGARLLDCDWVRAARADCIRAQVPFTFHGAGWLFRLDGRILHLSARGQSKAMASSLGLSYSPV